jgi:hypothetical protein
MEVHRIKAKITKTKHYAKLIAYFAFLLILTTFFITQTIGLPILRFVAVVFGYLWTFSLLYLLLEHLTR